MNNNQYVSEIRVGLIVVRNTVLMVASGQGSKVIGCPVFKTFGRDGCPQTN